MLSTHRPMLGARSDLSKSNPDRVFPAFLTPAGKSRAAERVELDHLLTSYFDDVALDAAKAASLAEIEAMYDDEAECQGCDVCDPCDCDVCDWAAGMDLGDDSDDEGSDEAAKLDDEWEASLLDEAGARSFADLARLVALDEADSYALDDDDLPGFGNHFNPEDLQWGFSLRTRP